MKCKITREVDVVIGGYTAPRGSRQYFGALLAGLYDGRALRFAGGVGTGFDQKMQKAIYEKLKTLGSGQCPFEPAPDTREKAQWIKPKLVARLKYANWTEDRRLRAPVFLALLDDHKPSDCQFKTETPIALSEALTESKSSGMMRHKEGKRGKQHDTPADGTLTDRKEIETRLLEGRDENLSLEIDGKPLRLTHLNKVYFPESGYTKRDLLAYYYKAAKYILPFLKDRPLVLKRYPDGISGKPFFQKDAGKAAQEWMETVTVHSEDEAKDIHYFVANDLAALLYLTNLGCIDHNPWSSRRDDLDHPDYLFFDLDPSDQTDFTVVVEIARAVYAKLMDLGMKVFLKTSGATGFHLYVPIDRNYTFDQVRTFADLIGQAVADENPKRVTRQRTISKRPPGTVMIDAYQNAPGRPLAPPYAVRAFPKAPVSTPILARELKR
ncbi:MAG: non-homologous end-joining DNA ligase, partial [Terriglobia bacterium]